MHTDSSVTFSIKDKYKKYFLVKELKMNYISTRDTAETPRSISSAEAIKTGLAPDSGLFMPESIPALDEAAIERLIPMTYAERATEILSMFLTDYDREALLADCTEAYSEARFPGGAAPVVPIGDGMYSLELWHGPPAPSRIWLYRSCPAFSPAPSQ